MQNGDGQPASYQRVTTDTSLQKALVQIGQARSGKGTTQRVLQGLIGAGNWP